MKKCSSLIITFLKLHSNILSYIYTLSNNVSFSYVTFSKTLEYEGKYGVYVPHQAQTSIFSAFE